MGTLGNFSDGMGWELSWGPSQGFDGRVGNFRDGLIAFCRESHPLQFSGSKQKQRFIRNRPNKWGFVQQTKELHQPKGWDLSDRSK